MKINRFLRRGLKGFSIVYFLTCLGLYFGQERMIYLPTVAHAKTPRSVGLKFEEVKLAIDGDAKSWVHGWWLPNPKATKTILYLHGIGLNIGSNITQAKQLYNQGFSVLLIDYRGYGQSSGPFPSEERIYQDTEVAWNYLTKTRGIAPKNIALYGHSLGGAIAIDLAIRHPDAGALVVQGSFTSMYDMAMKRQYNRLLPTKLLLHERFDSIAKVPNLKVPVLYVHGLKDETIEHQMSQQLYERSPEPRQLFLVMQGTHENGDLFWQAGTADVIKRFIEASASPQDGPSDRTLPHSTAPSQRKPAAVLNSP